MRFATYILNEKTYAGIFLNNCYYSFGDLLGKDAPETILEFVGKYGGETLPDFSSIISEKVIEGVPEGGVKLCAPIPWPLRAVFCLGTNYADHVKELAGSKLIQSGDLPSEPVYFAKNAYPAVGDKATIPLHSHFTNKVDYEVELAVIIGKEAWRIEPEQAEDVIFGYTILNDVSARDAQGKYGQWFLGKSLDSFCPIGPHIVTKDELPLTLELNVSCRVNGETRQSSNTSHLIFDIPRVVSELSQGVKLLPGDIIATGTPGGVGHGKNPPVYLKNGDVVECEIEQIGVLTNYFE